MPDILIVDDTPNNITVLSTMLNQRGYRVRAAINAEMALKSARIAAPALILLDIQMPGMNGYDLCLEFKRDAQLCDIPVIFLSALDAVEDKVKAFHVGGVDYISKPFQFEEVIARVENQLTLFHQRWEIANLRKKDRLYFEELSRTKDQFVNMVSHDLKNPLSTVMGYAALLAGCASVQNDPLASKYVARMQSGADNMLRLITDLLDLAKIETGVGLAISPVNLTHFLGQRLANFELLAENKHLELAFIPPPDDLSINIDESRMAQVVDNLLSNAIKYTPEGGRVELSTATEGNHFLIRVADSGLGIPAEDVPHIFDKFYRVDRKEHKAVDGTGLGLAIVRAIVEQHKGDIWAESKLGLGTVIHVALPLTISENN